jgi:hypothetical protein
MIVKTKKVHKTSTEVKRRKRILDAFGKFAQTKTSSASFASRKPLEIKREARHTK